MYIIFCTNVFVFPCGIFVILAGTWFNAESLMNFGYSMMTSSNGTIFRVTGPLCGEFTGPGEFPTQRPVTRSFDVYFDRRLNKRLGKQPWGWWFETLSWSLWRQCNALAMLGLLLPVFHSTNRCEMNTLLKHFQQYFMNTFNAYCHTGVQW